MEIIEYKGFEIEMSQDECPINPFEDWDVLHPTMVGSRQYRGREDITDYSKGEIVAHIAGHPTDGMIIRHQKRILDIIEKDPADFEGFTRSEKAGDIRYYIERLQDLDALAELCEIFKIPHLLTSSTGYSQGDYAEIFVVHTPEFEKKSGCKDSSEKSLQGTADLWGHWAWGGCLRL